jgi:hypothetical protein
VADQGNPSVHQATFFGGEWSPTAQGRLDKPQYKQALNVCLNALPIPTGAYVRRAGLEFLGPTYQRALPRLIPYCDIGGVSYLIVLTESWAHFYSGTAAVFTSDGAFTINSSSSAAGILTIVTASATGWSVGDQVKFQSIATESGAKYHNRVLQIATISTDTITLKDDTNTAFSFDSDTDALATAQVVRLQKSAHSFSDDAYFDLIRAIQAQTPTGTALFMVERHTAPQVITGTNLVISTASFKDGPYLDPQGGILSPEGGTVSAYTGSITFTPTTTVPVAADVGRHIRLFSQPAAWASGTTYTNGQYVTYNNQWWVFQYSSGLAGVIPGTTTTISGVPVAPWAPAPIAGQWAWGTITAQNGVAYTVSLTTNLNSANGATISKWRLGLFMASRYPACGIYHEGRLWFGGCANGAAAGAPQGRFDASTTDDIYTFSPTDIYGNVADNHAINYTLSGKRAFNTILWMEAIDNGDLLFGTAASEWRAEGIGGKFTPSTTKVTEITTYGAANVEPVRAGIAIIFPQRFGRVVYEYLADAFSTRFSARPINEEARHLVASASDEASGYYRLAYQAEKAPVVWAVAGGTALLGCTYRRTSRFVTEPPEFAGWHRHTFAAGLRIPVDVCVLPGSGASMANLVYLVTKNNGVGLAYDVCILRPLLDGES